MPSTRHGRMRNKHLRISSYFDAILSYRDQEEATYWRNSYWFRIKYSHITYILYLHLKPNHDVKFSFSVLWKIRKQFCKKVLRQLLSRCKINLWTAHYIQMDSPKINLGESIIYKWYNKIINRMPCIGAIVRRLVSGCRWGGRSC